MESKVSCAEKALLYGLPPLSPAGAYVRSVLRGLGVEPVTVSPTQLTEKTGALAGLSLYKRQEKQVPAQAADGQTADNAADMSFSRRPFVLLCGLPQDSFDALLAALRSLGAQNPLKAVLTETNRDWRFCDLMDAVAEEHAQMAARRG